MTDPEQTARDRRRRRGLERRRRAARPALDTSIPSPCISVCQVDGATGLCIGCRRSIDEIRDWPIMTAEQKTATLDRVAARKAQGARR